MYNIIIDIFDVITIFNWYDNFNPILNPNWTAEVPNARIPLRSEIISFFRGEDSGTGHSKALPLPTWIKNNLKIYFLSNRSLYFSLETNSYTLGDRHSCNLDEFACDPYRINLSCYHLLAESQKKKEVRQEWILSFPLPLAKLFNG